MGTGLRLTGGEVGHSRLISMGMEEDWLHGFCAYEREFCVYGMVWLCLRAYAGFALHYYRLSLFLFGGRVVITIRRGAVLLRDTSKDGRLDAEEEDLDSTTASLSNMLFGIVNFKVLSQAFIQAQPRFTQPSSSP